MRYVAILTICLFSLIRNGPIIAGGKEPVKDEVKDEVKEPLRKEDEDHLRDLTRIPALINHWDNTQNFDSMVADNEEDFPFFPSRMTTGGKTLTPESFTSPNVCAACHTDIYNQWQQSVMGHSWKDPIYRALLSRASAATGGKVDKLCIGCHSPSGLTTGTTTANESGPLGDNGVDCEACHTVSGVSGLGNGSLVLTPKLYGRMLQFGPRKDAVSPFHDTAYSKLHTQSELCASCHNVTHPFNMLPVERTYDEWRDSPYRALGITCQECHMTPGAGQARVSGKLALMGPERDKVANHSFIGANVTLHNRFDNPEMAEKAREMLRSAAEIDFVALPQTVTPGQTVVVEVVVRNVGAGHKLPTGFPEGREMWVDFKVHDATGREVYRLGAVEAGHTEHGTHSFKATLGDADGNVVDIAVWDADRVLSDTRILPKGQAVVSYHFAVPEAVQGPLTLSADLNYWSFPQAIVDDLLGKGELAVEVVLMGSVTHPLPLTAH